MGNDKYALDLLKELSPFKQKYFFLIFVPFMISISVFIPYDDYSGISIKSQTSFLDEKAKILTDTFLFMTIFMSLYIFIKYRFIGVSRELHNRMLKAINFVSFKQKEKETGVYLKNMSWFLCFIYFLLFIKMFLLQHQIHQNITGYMGLELLLRLYIRFFLCCFSKFYNINSLGI